ncbi:TetR/AcrR family transcriptional regulator [Actinomadura parmotrematis]|uniref:TetR/AcrR family transcriptional regulator n=1 Tax=Actinomadura parmotrematis TaxID=2864039 RepID=A0ABS7FVT3_9ACTN|nr:TetR/AcrR family transcriptional regulator [Actinomadura parmotrematis]MBW8484537.1 TetR/AcrR family transcriptional regulator [Actinomadura parmotrematis]
MSGEISAEAGLGLRERKKLRTRRAIRREAYRLFAEQGYQATTVEQIAAAAEVSPSTVFRYFATKEDIVLADEHDLPLAEALRARPRDEPLLESLRRVVADSIGAVIERDAAALAVQIRLATSDPDIRARAFEDQFTSQRRLAELIAERTGRAPDDLDVATAAAAVIALSFTVLRHWVDGGCTADVTALYDRQFAFLAAGLPFS